MNPFDLPVEQFEVFVLIMIRCLAILAALPVIGNKNVPLMVKTGFAVTTAILVFPSVDTERLRIPSSSLALVLAILGEIAIGLFIGYMANLVFVAIQVAGQFMGYQMGFAIVSIIDPQTSNRLSIIALFENLFAILLFFALNIHHVLLQAMSDSFQLIPLLGSHYPLGLMKQLVESTGALFTVAIKVGAPIMAVLLFTNVSMGVIARTVPQMNVFIVAFPIQIGVGLIVLGLTLPMTAEFLKNSFFTMGQEINIMLRMMRSG